MKEIVNPPKQLNLPRDLYDNLPHFIPYPSDDPAIVAKRRNERGALIADMEMRGIQVLSELQPARFESKLSQHAARDILTRVGIGSAQYNLACDDRMYSPVRLGVVADGRRVAYATQYYRTPEEIAVDTARWINRAAVVAEARYRHTRVPDNIDLITLNTRSTGRYLANASLSALAYDMAGEVRHLHPVDAQLAVRDASLKLLREIEEYGNGIGARPSVAQLVEPDSPIAVDIRRHAPRDIRKAFESAAAAHPEHSAS